MDDYFGFKYIDRSGQVACGTVWSDAHLLNSKWVIPQGGRCAILVALRVGPEGKKWRVIDG